MGVKGMQLCEQTWAPLRGWGGVGSSDMLTNREQVPVTRVKSQEQTHENGAQEAAETKPA